MTGSVVVECPSSLVTEVEVIRSVEVETSVEVIDVSVE